jgi:hypothetical protein
MQLRYAIVAPRIVAGFSWRVQNAPGRPSDIGVAHRGNGTHLLHIVARAVYHDEGHESRFVHASLGMRFSSRVRICAWICLRRASRCDHPAIWKLIATRIIDAISNVPFNVAEKKKVLDCYLFSTQKIRLPFTSLTGFFFRPAAAAACEKAYLLHALAFNSHINYRP